MYIKFDGVSTFHLFVPCRRDLEERTCASCASMIDCVSQSTFEEAVCGTSFLEAHQVVLIQRCFKILKTSFPGKSKHAKTMCLHGFSSPMRRVVGDLICFFMLMMFVERC